jgi:hypothetical protein
MIRESSAVVFFSDVFMGSLRLSLLLPYRYVIVVNNNLSEFLKNGKSGKKSLGGCEPCRMKPLMSRNFATGSKDESKPRCC